MKFCLFITVATQDRLFVSCSDSTGESAQSETSFTLLERNRSTMENEAKGLLGDIPLDMDNRVILVHLDTIRFARLKTHESKAVSHVTVLYLLVDDYSRIVQLSKGYDIHKHAVAALKECVGITKIDFPHLYRNTQPGLSASSKQNIRMCLKKSERNILIFIVRLHYAILVCNAFRLASGRRDLPPFVFDFGTFPELKSVLIELEHDRECAVKHTYRKKANRIKLEASMDPDENDLMERLDQLESNLTSEFRKTFQDVYHALGAKIDSVRR